MDLNDINDFDDFIEFCRIINNNSSEYNDETNNENNEFNYCNNATNSCRDCEFGNKNADASEESRNSNSDIPGGFQDLNPQLLTIVTSIFGAIAAGNMPFNIQNAIGNWLMLLGQVIVTFNAQQQYFQGGPGRVYNQIYRNAANPFCSSNSDENQKGTKANKSSNTKKSNLNLKSNSEKFKSKDSKSSKKGNVVESISKNDIDQLIYYINKLNQEIKELKKEIDKLKK